MSMRKSRALAPAHPDDEALQTATDPSVAAHAADCPRCTRRLQEFQQLRSLVQLAALREEVPRRDLAMGALARLRLRRRGSSQLNELLAGLADFLRNLASLLAPAEQADEAPPASAQAAPSEGEDSHD